MPSFDVVSEVDLQEARNAVDQANREVGNRFDFKGSDAEFALDGAEIKLQAQNEFQLEQMMDVLNKKLTKRSVDIGCLDLSDPEVANNRARQTATLRLGIDTDTARRIVSPAARPRRGNAERAERELIRANAIGQRRLAGRRYI